MLAQDATPFFEALSDARRTVHWARSIVLIGAYSLDTEGDYRTTRQTLRGRTARTYAYYPVVRQIAEQVTAFIVASGYRAVHGQQIPLKYVASRIGMGSYGQNGLLLTKEFGSYVVLRAVLTDAELEADAFMPPAPPCADCGRCLKACPTGALYAPYKVNPALCINPLTRKEEDVPPELREKMGTWVCGCDVCQQVCPTNRDLEPREPDERAGFGASNHASHRTLNGLQRCPGLEEVLCDNAFLLMRRNAIMALGNIGTDAAKEALLRCRETCPGELRPYLAWATDRLAERKARRSATRAADE